MSKDKKEKSTKDIRCHECSGFEHVRDDCLNYKRYKVKAMNATLSDELDSEDLYEPIDMNDNFMAFSASMRSDRGSNSL